jgi:hypothetical protein
MGIENEPQLRRSLDRRPQETLHLRADIALPVTPILQIALPKVVGEEERILRRGAERGYVRPEDELPIASEADVETDPADEDATAVQAEDDDASAGADSPADEPEEDDGIKPIPDRLMTELTAHRTLALRHALCATSVPALPTSGAIANAVCGHAV